MEKYKAKDGITRNDHLKTSFKYCENLDKDKNLILPDINELSLIFLNYKLIYNLKNETKWFISRSVAGSDIVWTVNVIGGHRSFVSRGLGDDNYYVRCVRRTELK